MTFFLGTVRPDGTPHAAGLGALWEDETMWFVAGPRTRKARNLALNAACTISARLPGIDVVLEGEAVRVSDADALERLASRYRDAGWPAEVESDAFTVRIARRAPGLPRGTFTGWCSTRRSALRPRNRTGPPASGSMHNVAEGRR